MGSILYISNKYVVLIEQVVIENFSLNLVCLYAPSCFFVYEMSCVAFSLPYSFSRNGHNSTTYQFKQGI